MDEIWCYAKLREFDPDNVIADLCLSDQSGRIIAQMVGLCLRKLSFAAVTQRADHDARFSESRERRETLTPAKATSSTNPEHLLEALSAKEQRSMLLAYIQQQGAHISGYPESKFDQDSCLVELGFDSLMAIMLTNRIKSDLGLTLSIGRLLSSSTIQALSEELHKQWVEKDRQERTD